MAFDLASAKPVEGFDLASAKPVQSDEPGIFQPGSNTEAFTRGAADSSTLGLGKYIAAKLSSTGVPDALMQLGAGSTDPDKNRFQAAWDAIKNAPTYDQALADNRASNSAAANSNPAAYLTGSVAGAIPQAANIASLTKAAPTLLAKVGTAGGAGAVTGGVQGAANANNLSEVPEEAARGAAIGGAVNAVMPALGAGLSAAGRYGTKAVQSATKAASPLLKDVVEVPGSPGKFFNTATKRMVGEGGTPYGAVPELDAKGMPILMRSSVPSAGAAVQAAVPTGGAVYGYFNGAGSQDPYQSISSKLGNAAQGMAMGAAIPLGMKYGQAGLRGAGNAFSSMTGQTAAAAGEQGAAPFSKITDYISQAAGATNPEVQQAGQDADAAMKAAADDAAKKRKIAMEMTKDPVARAVGNSSSPMR